MPSITDTPALVTPPEHDLPVVRAFWDAYDDAYALMCEAAGGPVGFLNDEAVCEAVNTLITAVYKARS